MASVVVKITAPASDLEVLRASLSLFTEDSMSLKQYLDNNIENFRRSFGKNAVSEVLSIETGS